MFKAARTEIAQYCNIAPAKKLSVNDVQNLAFAIAGNRAVDASRFAFRADLSVGLFFAFAFGAIVTLCEFYKFDWMDRWLIEFFVYSVLALGFALRAWFYFDIRGRIIIPIALAVLAEDKQKAAPKA
jgi:hypothetical protein